MVKLSAGARSLVLLLGLAISGCSRLQAPPPAPAPPAAVETLEGTPPRDLPRVVRNRYRLRPDRRLLIAVSEVERLSTGKPPCTAAAVLDGETWKVTCNDTPVGTLPDLPDFEDGTRLLVEWARRVKVSRAGDEVDLERLAIADRSIDTGDPAQIIEGLATLNPFFPGASRDPAVLRSAARGFLALCRMVYDALQQADAVGSEAWALVALSRASGEGHSTETEAMVANALGYEAAAASAARQLADDSPAKWLVLADWARLRQACAAAKSQDCGYFDRVVASAEDTSGEFGVTAQDFPGIVRAVFHVDGKYGSLVGERLASAALGAVRPAGEPGSPEIWSPFAVAAESKAFEEAAASFGRRFDGGLIAGDTVTAFYRANYYGGLHRIANYCLEHLSSGPAARDLADTMTDPAPGTAAELKRWINLRADVEDGSQDPLPIVTGVLEMKSIGAWPLARVVYTVFRRSATTAPLRRRPVAAAFTMLDSRPNYLDAAAWAAKNNLESPALFEYYARAAAAQAPHSSGELPALVALLDENASGLREIAADPRMGNYTREVAVYGLHELGSQDRDSMRAFYEGLVTSDPEASSLSGLVSFLERAGDLQAAADAVDAVLRRDPNRRDLVWVHWCALKARLLAAQGKLDEAWAVVEPVVESWKEDALIEAASIQLRRGKIGEGLELAQRALERYPDDDHASALIAQAKWRQGEFAAVAKELSENRNGLVKDWSVYLPRAFAEAFATAPERAVRQAFDELLRVNIAPHIVSDMLLELGRKGKLDLAFELQDRLHDPLPEWDSGMRIRAYDLLAEKRGETEALAWFQKSPVVRSHPFALTLFQMRKYELLWGLFPAGQEGPKPGIVRLVKAAALLHLREHASPRRDALRAAVEQDPDQKDFFVKATLFLLGKGDADSMFEPRPHNHEQIANVAWAQGMRALADGRFRDAESWFQVVQETGQQNLPPHAWAWQILSDWNVKRRSLDLLQKQSAL